MPSIDSALISSPRRLYALFWLIMSGSETVTNADRFNLYVYVLSSVRVRTDRIPMSDRCLRQ